jgi:cytoskeleton protein RodZ
MSQAGFGEHLRREREMRGVSLQEIAGATRISTRFLDALEKEAWERLPGGVFNRGFVRTVARFLGLEEESLLAEYSLAIGEPAVTEAPAPAPPPSRELILRKPWVAAAAFAVLCLAAVGWAGFALYQTRMESLNAALTSWPPAPTPPAFPPTAVEIPEAAPAILPPQAASPAPEASIPTSPWAEPPAEEQVATSPGASDASELLLKIDAARPTFVKITSDGLEAFSGRMVAGESRAFTAQNAFAVETMDAGAVRMELNGRALAPIGPSGQSGQVTLARSDLRPRPGGPD